MTTKQEEELKLEIAHIFDSGANEIRIKNMVKLFCERRFGNPINELIADYERKIETATNMICDPTEHPALAGRMRVSRSAWRKFISELKKIVE